MKKKTKKILKRKKIGGANPTLPLSMLLHEFCLFANYQINGNPNIIFYVQPTSHMSYIVSRTYNIQTERFTQEDFQCIVALCGENPTVYMEGFKINFTDIFQKYNNQIPREFSISDFSNIKNDYGFGLLDRTNMEHCLLIDTFYTKIKMNFCNISVFGLGNLNDFVDGLKKKYSFLIEVPNESFIKDYLTFNEVELTEEILGNISQNKINLEPLGLNRKYNFESQGVLKFLLQIIQNFGMLLSKKNLISIIDDYINIVSYLIGDVKLCLGGEREGRYMAYKLLDPSGPFCFNNVEMVISRIEFDNKLQFQYHINIMKNPVIFIKRKMEKHLGELQIPEEFKDMIRSILEYKLSIIN